MREDRPAAFLVDLALGLAEAAASAHALLGVFAPSRLRSSELLRLDLRLRGGGGPWEAIAADSKSSPARVDPVGYLRASWSGRDADWPAAALSASVRSFSAALHGHVSADRIQAGLRVEAQGAFLTVSNREAVPIYCSVERTGGVRMAPDMAPEAEAAAAFAAGLEDGERRLVAVSEARRSSMSAHERLEADMEGEGFDAAARDSLSKRPADAWFVSRCGGAAVLLRRQAHWIDIVGSASVPLVPPRT